MMTFTTGRFQKGFTLFEMMMALAILCLIFTAATVSLRGKWRAEPSRRGAQQLAMLWMKARSCAWREGRAWVLSRDGTSLEWRVAPQEALENPDGWEPVKNEGGGGGGFSVRLDTEIQVVAEGGNSEGGAIHFYTDGRVEEVSFLVQSAGADVWRLRTDWSGTPVLELVKGSGEGLATPAPKVFPVLDPERKGEQ